MRAPLPPSTPRRRGAALLVALLVVTVATLIVSDLFWRQFVLFRYVENEQADAQAGMILHGAQDWARAILQDQPHPAYDALSDPWAQPLAPTRLDQLGESAPLASQATLEGAIEDAQARFNLRSLVDGAGNLNEGALATFDKLAGLLGAPSGTARLVAQYLAACYRGVSPLALPGIGNGAVQVSAVTRPLPPVFPDDLAGVPGIDGGAAQALAPYVILLDQGGTSINFNTAGPVMMAAAIPALGIADATALAAERDRAYFTSVADIQNRLHGRGGATTLAGISTTSQYFIVQGVVHLEHAASRSRALVRRNGSGVSGSVVVLWEEIP